MKIQTEDLGNRQVMLTIEVDTERVDQELRGVARRVAREYNIPGFRRGRAPYHIVLQRFGREALLQEALDDLAQEVIGQALERENIEPYNAGSLEDVQLDPLTFKLRVPLRPVVDLGGYRELRVEPPVVQINEGELTEELDELRESNAILEPAGDRPTQLGDWVSIDVQAELGGESLISEDAREMVLDSEDAGFATGFVDQVIGMHAGEDNQFTLTLGEEWGEEKAGKEATFTISLREVRGRMVPDLDDDLARTVGDFDSLEELRQSVHDRLAADAQRDADNTHVEEVLNTLVARASIEYPPDVIEAQIDDMAQDLERRLESQGISLDDYYKLSGQTEEAFRASMRSQAQTVVERGLVLGELARMEKLDVEGQEVDERIDLLSASWGERASEVRDLLSVPDRLRSIATSLLTDKAVQRAVAIAKGEAPPLDDEGEPPVQEEEASPGETEPLLDEPVSVESEGVAVELLETATVEVAGDSNAEVKSTSEAN